MKFNRCFGCMEEIQGYPCPHCGFDPRSVKGIEYALPMGTILAGKYLVGRVLGQGGFGITYVGWDIALERKVAIKEYYPSGQVSRNPGSRGLTWYTSVQSQQAKQNGTQIFLKEARKMSKVDDIPNVVRVRDLFQENETAYIVMDFVEGETLKARLEKTGPLPWEQAKGIFLPAIQAMEQVHQAGLVHRDISPDNLMLTPDGKVKILDLGAAKDLSVNNGASSMQVAKGGFSPFEQYTQRGSSGPWTDVYAMAATVYPDRKTAARRHRPGGGGHHLMGGTRPESVVGAGAGSAAKGHGDIRQKPDAEHGGTGKGTVQHNGKTGTRASTSGGAGNPAGTPARTRNPAGISTRAGVQAKISADTGTRASGPIGTQAGSG